MEKEELQKKIEKKIKKFKNYYSKHLERFSCNDCSKCPLNEGLDFGMFCDLYFSTVFGIGGVIGCKTRREMCIKILKEEHIKSVKNHVNKI